MSLPDIQAEVDQRGIAIDEVGVAALRYPIVIHCPEHGNQHTVARISLSAALGARERGSHLSRFIKVFDAYNHELSLRSLGPLLGELKESLKTTSAQLKAQFPYFLRRFAPVSGAGAFVDYDCALYALLVGDELNIRLGVRVPVTTVCPCSKAISDYGAHNQRGQLCVEAVLSVDALRILPTLWFDDLIDASEASASSPVYPLLQRIDERRVTMGGYDHPMFVEDMVRAVVQRLRQDPRITEVSVEATNEESIHNHNAFARLTWSADHKHPIQ